MLFRCCALPPNCKSRSLSMLKSTAWASLRAQKIYFSSDHHTTPVQSNAVSFDLNLIHELAARHQVRGPVSSCSCSWLAHFDHVDHYQQFEANPLLAQFSCQLDNLACVLDANAMRNWSANCSCHPFQVVTTGTTDIMSVGFPGVLLQNLRPVIERRHAMLILKLKVSRHHGSAIDRLIDQHCCLFSHPEGVKQFWNRCFFSDCSLKKHLFQNCLTPSRWEKRQQCWSINLSIALLWRQRLIQMTPAEAVFLLPLRTVSRKYVQHHSMVSFQGFHGCWSDLDRNPFSAPSISTSSLATVPARCKVVDLKQKWFRFSSLPGMQWLGLELLDQPIGSIYASGIGVWSPNNHRTKLTNTFSVASCVWR